MLGKLIKWDLAADWKKYTTLYAATLLVSVMLSVTIKISEKIRYNRFLELAEFVFSSAFIILIVSIFILVVAFTIMRFYKNVIRDEGYLTHTLPVHTWQILLSKLISSYIWFFSAVIVGCLCMVIPSGDPLESFRAIKDGIEYMYDNDRHMMAMFTAITALSPFFLLSHVYFCFALGNLSNNHKMGVSVLSFFGINIAENILSAFVIESVTIMESWQVEMVMLRTLAVAFTFSIVFFIAAERIFAKKLNLE